MKNEELNIAIVDIQRSFFHDINGELSPSFQKTKSLRERSCI